MGYIWVTHGLQLGYTWVTAGLHMGYAWAATGLKLGYSPACEDGFPRVHRGASARASPDLQAVLPEVLHQVLRPTSAAEKLPLVGSSKGPPRGVEEPTSGNFSRAVLGDIVRLQFVRVLLQRLVVQQDAWPHRKTPSF